jgi:hypothetical protein
MRPILFYAAIIGAASVLASTDAMAQLESNQAPVLGAEFYAPFFFGSRHVDEPVSSKKQVSTKQGSARHGSVLRPAASTRISTGPASRPVIPLPDHALLTPQAEFDCEFKTTVVDDASNQPQPSPTRAQADPSPDVVLGMKLDYERQCYQHTAMIVRHRLRLLQASVGETIKAAFFGTIKAEPPQEAQ